MKKIDITLWEISKHEAKQLKELTAVLIYNTLSGYYSLELANTKSIFNNKYCSEYLKFFTFEEPIFKENL